jgi:hypothetical protein
VDCPVTLAAMLRPDQPLIPGGVEVVAPADPEGKRDAKRELGKLMLESYKETRQQPKFSALIDLKTASENSRSFRRMVHAVETLAGMRVS